MGGARDSEIYAFRCPSSLSVYNRVGSIVLSTSLSQLTGYVEEAGLPCVAEKFYPDPTVVKNVLTIGDSLVRWILSCWFWFLRIPHHTFYIPNTKEGKNEHGSSFFSSVFHFHFSLCFSLSRRSARRCSRLPRGSRGWSWRTSSSQTIPRLNSSNHVSTCALHSLTHLVNYEQELDLVLSVSRLDQPLVSPPSPPPAPAPSCSRDHVADVAVASSLGCILKENCSVIVLKMFKVDRPRLKCSLCLSPLCLRVFIFVCCLLDAAVFFWIAHHSSQLFLKALSFFFHHFLLVLFLSHNHCPSLNCSPLLSFLSSRSVFPSCARESLSLTFLLSLFFRLSLFHLFFLRLGSELICLLFRLLSQIFVSVLLCSLVSTTILNANIVLLFLRSPSSSVFFTYRRTSCSLRADLILSQHGCSLSSHVLASSLFFFLSCIGFWSSRRSLVDMNRSFLFPFSDHILITLLFAVLVQTNIDWGSGFFSFALQKYKGVLCHDFCFSPDREKGRKRRRGGEDRRRKRVEKKKEMRKERKEQCKKRERWEKEGMKKIRKSRWLCRNCWINCNLFFSQ